MSTITLSDAALALLRSAFELGRAEVTDETREGYRELARAGLMFPLHTFSGGRESGYRLTDDARMRRDELLSAPAVPYPPPQSS